MNVRVRLILGVVVCLALAGCAGVPAVESSTSPPETSLATTTPPTTQPVTTTFTTVPPSSPPTTTYSYVPPRTTPTRSPFPPAQTNYVVNLFHTTDRGDIYIDVTYYRGLSERFTKTFDVLKVGEDFVPRSLFNPQQGIYWTFGGYTSYPKVTSLTVSWSESGDNITYQKLYDFLWNNRIDQQTDFLNYTALSSDLGKLTAAYAARLQSDAVKAGIACAQVAIQWTAPSIP